MNDIRRQITFEHTIYCEWYLGINVRENRRQSRMHSPEDQAPSCTRYRTKINKAKNPTQTTNMMSNTDPIKTEVNRVAHHGLAVLVSYKTPAVDV